MPHSVAPINAAVLLESKVTFKWPSVRRTITNSDRICVKGSWCSWQKTV